MDVGIKMQNQVLQKSDGIMKFPKNSIFYLWYVNTEWFISF